MKKKVVKTKHPMKTGHDFFIQWHLTERCNLRCSHCYQGEADKKELSFTEIRNVLEEFRKTLREWTETYDISFSPSFTITGGEPFLRRDILQVLEEFRKEEIDIYILSNGTLIDRNRAEALCRLGVKGVQVSIEGPRKIHDRIRGNGSFIRALKGVRHLLNSGIRVTLNVTLSEMNADYVQELVSLAASEGVHHLGFSRLVPCGRGRQLLHKMMDKQKVKEIYQSLLSVQVDGLEIVTGDPVASQMDLKANSDMGYTACAGCAAGISGLTLRPDGTINPCRRLDIPIGNIRNDSLREVWAASEVLNSLRDKSKYKGKCGTCSRWAVCRGCRAIAYAYSASKGEADYLAEDPQCFIE
jgi:radical SAM protein with 4Fe4S-binding SPASM domain